MGEQGQNGDAMENMDSEGGEREGESDVRP